LHRHCLGEEDEAALEKMLTPFKFSVRRHNQFNEQTMDDWIALDSLIKIFPLRAQRKLSRLSFSRASPDDERGIYRYARHGSAHSPTVVPIRIHDRTAIWRNGRNTLLLEEHESFAEKIARRRLRFEFPHLETAMKRINRLVVNYKFFAFAFTCKFRTNRFFNEDLALENSEVPSASSL